MVNKEKFVRYGKLKPVKQKGVKKDNFHSPPKSKGFYSFPFGYEEIFLVAGLPYQNIGLPKVVKHEKWVYKDPMNLEYGVTVRTDEWDTVNIWKVKKTFTVNDNELIWHHLDEYIKNKKDIIETSKSWVCTTVKVWRKAFNICLNKQKMTHWKEFKKGNIKEIPNGGYYSKDHLEVFFTHKIK